MAKMNKLYSLIQINTTNVVTILSNVSICIVMVLYMGLSVSPVFAQDPVSPPDQLPLQYLKITPILSDIVLKPGKPTTIPLSIQNLSGKPMGIHAETSGFDETADSSLSQVPSLLAEWTTLSEQDIIINSKETKTINVVINPPSGTKTGGYYEAVFLTPYISQRRTPDRPIVLSRIGALIFATVGKLNSDDLSKKVQITSFKPRSIFTDQTSDELEFSVKNSYFTHFTAKPFLTIKPLFGPPEQITVDEKHVLPGKERIWKVETQKKKWNFYNADLAVSVGNGNQLHAKSWFVVIPNLKFAGIIMLLILIFILSKLKRIRKAIKILFR